MTDPDAPDETPASAAAVGRFSVCVVSGQYGHYRPDVEPAPHGRLVLYEEVLPLLQELDRLRRLRDAAKAYAPHLPKAKGSAARFSSHAVAAQHLRAALRDARTEPPETKP